MSFSVAAFWSVGGPDPVVASRHQRFFRLSSSSPPNAEDHCLGGPQEELIDAN